MNAIRVFNRCLWGLNVVIALLIVAQVQRIASTVGTSFLAGRFEPIDPRPLDRPDEQVASFGVLLDLPNPIRTRVYRHGPCPVPEVRAELLGTLSRSAPEKGWAFFRAGRREFPVALGEALPDEFRAWRVVEIARGRAVLANGPRQHTLLIE